MTHKALPLFTIVALLLGTLFIAPALAEETATVKFKEAVIALDRGAVAVAKMLTQEGIGLAQRSGNASAMDHGQQALEALEKGDEIGARDSLTAAVTASEKTSETRVAEPAATEPEAGPSTESTGKSAAGAETTAEEEENGKVETAAAADKIPQTDAGMPLPTLAGLSLVLLGFLLLLSRRLALRKAR